MIPRAHSDAPSPEWVCRGTDATRVLSIGKGGFVTPEQRGSAKSAFLFRFCRATLTGVLRIARRFAIKDGYADTVVDRARDAGWYTLNFPGG